MPEPDRVSPRRIGAMLMHMSIEDVAERFRMTVAEVEAMAPKGAVLQIEVTDHANGRTFMARGWRSAYLRAQIDGLTDWDWRAV